MRIIAITEKVIKELFRDKRTLAMMFLMNVMFSANSNTKVKIGTINANTKVVSNLDNIKHIQVRSFKFNSSAKKHSNQIKLILLFRRTINLILSSMRIQILQRQR